MVAQYSDNGFNFGWKDLFKRTPDVSSDIKSLFANDFNKMKKKDIADLLKGDNLEKYLGNKGIEAPDFVEWAKGINQADFSLKNYEKDLSKNNKTTSRFQNLSKSAGAALKSFGATALNMDVGMDAGIALEKAQTSVDEYQNTLSEIESINSEHRNKSRFMVYSYLCVQFILNTIIFERMRLN